MQSRAALRTPLPAGRGAALRAACVGAVVLGIAGCGGGDAGRLPADTVTYPASIPPLSATAPARIDRPAIARRRRDPVAPRIGTAQQTVSRDAHLTVTVQRLIDPLTGSGAALLPGTRAVAVLVTLSNAGPALYDSSATGDFAVVASRGAVTPLFVPAGICQTPVEDFDRYMTAGELRSGCVAFAVAGDARVRLIRFSPHAGAAGRLTWSAGRG